LSKNDAVRTRLILFLASLLAFGAEAFTQTPARYDVLIRNGPVLDGSGNPWLAADLGIRAGRTSTWAGSAMRRRRASSTRAA
jgi:hypothetical protein